MNTFLYDKQDFVFLEQINKIIENNKENKETKQQPCMHPNGIIDLTSSQELRMASAVLNLLDSLEMQNAPTRLLALENLHQEILLTARTKFRYNTSRVLMEIMKEIVRSYGMREKQIQHVHDFRMAAKGNPNLVRKFLKKYYLLEMPEEWNQLTFDHHVHDANTKGRKSPTHLIMDAWIKGIRSLTVIYYHYVAKEAASELIRAAHIMGIKIRIGILYNLVYRHKLLDFIWIPQENILDAFSFMEFLENPRMQQLHEQGLSINAWKERYILKILHEWNDFIRQKMQDEFEIPFDYISQEEFQEFVSCGQSSALHLAELIHQKVLPEITKKAYSYIFEKDNEKNETQKIKIYNKIQTLDSLTPEYFFEVLEDCEHIQEKFMITEILQNKNNTIPELLLKKPEELLTLLHATSNASFVTLNLSRLTPEDVLNIIWDCKGLLTHLEIFNVYDWHNGNLHYTSEINELMSAINTKNTPNLKQYIQTLIKSCQDEEKNACSEIVNHHLYKQKLSQAKKEIYLENVIQSQKILNERLVNIPNNMSEAVSNFISNEAHNIHNTEILEKNFENISTKNIDTCITDTRRAIYNHQTCKTCAQNDCTNMFDIHRYHEHESPFCFISISKEERIEKLSLILQNIITLTEYYDARKLLTRMGTDSTSRAGRIAGMGLAYFDTLARKAKKELRNNSNESRVLLPVQKEVKEVITYHIPFASHRLSFCKKLLRASSLFRKFTLKKTIHFEDNEAKTNVFNHGMCSEINRDYISDNSKIVTLGGLGVRANNEFLQKENQKPNKKTSGIHTIPLNTNFLNILKVIIGFIPAFLSFQYTQDIPFLAWGGAIIWFLITGFRNIIQAVLGGGGFQRSPLLRWNNYVSWSRLADSLMYTGLSVVLLELIVRNLLLTNVFGITSLNAPLLTFTIISLLNGMYIVVHNIIRGLQLQAIIGNFFRSFFAIPVALLYNTLFTALLISLDIANIDIVLLSSSAILSKIASDTVAGIIEGLADKGSNMWRRHLDYEISTKEMYANYAQLELEFPNDNVLTMLCESEKFCTILQEQNKSLYKKIILNALDFQYFYYYQPRAYSTLKNIVSTLSDAERLLWVRMQSVLMCKKQVSQLLVDGIINDNFVDALSFYLSKHEEYINDMGRLFNLKKTLI